MSLVTFLSTQSGQKWLIQKSLFLLEQHTQTSIQTTKFEYIFPFQLHIEGLLILQDAIPILSIEQLNIVCDYWQLMKGKLVFSAVRADQIKIDNLPTPTEIENKSDGKFENFYFPFYLKIEDLDLQSISINPTLIEKFSLPIPSQNQAEYLNLSISGSIKNNPFKNSFLINSIIEIANFPSIPFPLKVSLNIKNRQLTLYLSCDPVTYSLDLAGQVVPLTLKGDFLANIEDWRRIINEPFNQQNKINGSYQALIKLPQDSFYQEFLGKDLKIQGKFSTKQLNLLTLSEVEIISPLMTIGGKITVDRNLNIRENYFHGAINYLEKLSFLTKKNISGALTFEGNLLGQIYSPQLNFAGSIPELSFNNHLFQNLHIILKNRLASGQINGPIQLTFEHQNQFVDLNTFLDANKKSVTFSNLEIKMLDSHLNGEININLENLIANGEVNIEFHRLETLSSFLKFPSLEGNGLALIKFKSAFNIENQQQQAFDVEFTSSKLMFKNIQADEFKGLAKFYPSLKKSNLFTFQTEMELKQIQFEDYYAAEFSINSTQNLDLNNKTLADITSQIHLNDFSSNLGELQKGEIDFFMIDPLGDSQGEINVFLEQMSAQPFQFDHIKAKTILNPNKEACSFNMTLQRQDRANWETYIDGFWSFKDIFTIHVKQLEGIYGPYPLKLKKALTILYDQTNLSSSELNLTFGKADIQANFQLIDRDIQLDFQTNDVSASMIKSFIPDLPITGKASFEGRLGGSLEHPKGDLRITLKNMQITEEIFAQKPLVQGEINLAISDSEIHLKSHLNGIGTTPVYLDGLLPIAFSFSPLTMKVKSESPFSMDLNAQGEIGPYMHLLYNDTTNLTGQLKIAINLSGEINNPQVKGSIDFSEGTYESLKSGSIYRHIQAHLEGDGSEITVQKFSAQNNKSGSITATGIISLNREDYFPFDIKLEPKQIAIMESDYADIEASGPLYLIGNLKKSKLQGHLTVDKAIIHMEEALPQQIKSVPVIYVNQNLDRKSKPSVEVSNSSPLEFDIKLDIPPGNLLIEGNHLSSEWEGDVTIFGKANKFLLNGDLRVINGNYDFNGKEFNLSQGNIHFAGSPGKKTTIYVVASKEIDRIKADIIVKGAADKLAVSFRSNPPLSQREILSYILFNRGIADITPDQGDQLSQSFISLNASEQNSSSNDFLTKIRNNIGIDRLDITANDNENKDFSLQIGKYITEGVFVSINKSISDMGNRLAVEANIHKNLKAQAEVELGTANQGKISLKWKKDY
jgi:translocation and assembly module TamB